MPITSNQLLTLSAKANVYWKTAKNWLDPKYRPRMKPSVQARIAQAAAELGIEIPNKEQATNG